MPLERLGRTSEALIIDRPSAEAVAAENGGFFSTEITPDSIEVNRPL
jgi:hypothetical protein